MSRPLGVADLEWSGEHLVRPVLQDHWYWCRVHETAERFRQPHPAIGHDKATCLICKLGDDKRHNRFVLPCIRVGPFMSEREANILRREHPEYPEGDKPLGMEIEP